VYLPDQCQNRGDEKTAGGADDELAPCGGLGKRSCVPLK
jgi:hypothetical protein